jgi:hypothetical protein
VGGYIRAQGIELGFELRIEHVADHGHAGDHCDIPPKSAWLNCAIRPPPLRRAVMTTCTAAGDTECLFAKSSTNSPSVSAISFIFLDSNGAWLASTSGFVRQTFEPERRSG